jgi:hypothetical protein
MRYFFSVIEFSLATMVLISETSRKFEFTRPTGKFSRNPIIHGGGVEIPQKSPFFGSVCRRWDGSNCRKSQVSLSVGGEFLAFIIPIRQHRV